MSNGVPCESGNEECGHLYHYISTTLYLSTVMLMLSDSLSIAREENETYMVDGVEPALVLEHENLLP